MDRTPHNTTYQNDIKDNVFFEQVRILHKNILISVPANCVCAGIVFLGLDQMAKNSLFIYWIIAILFISLFRLIATYFYYISPEKATLHTWIFILGMTISAGLWGIADSVLMPKDDPFKQMVLIIIVAGITGGGIQTLIANLAASMIYVSVIIVPLCIWLFLQKGFNYSLIGIAMLTYLMFMLVTSVRGYQLLKRSLILQHENAALLNKLSASNIKLLESYHQLESHEQQIILVNKLNDMLQTCQTSSQAYFAINLIAKELFNEFSGALTILNLDTRHLEVVTQWGDDQAIKSKFEILDCCGLQSSQHYFLNDPTNYATCTHFNALPNSYICLPLMTQNQVMGLIIIHSSVKNIFSEDKIHLMNNFREVIQISLANISLRQTLYDQSIHDPLTGLYNRRYLDTTLPIELKRTIHEKNSLCVAMFDLDHFKNFNDNNGHEAGDEVLKFVSTLLSTNFRDDDIACRFGGEEFLVVMKNTRLSLAFQRLLDIAEIIKNGKVYFNGQQLPQITVSIGVAEAPMHGDTLVEIIQAADEALYTAKKNGRNKVESYSRSVYAH